jgi:hypothetical protein
LRCRHHEIRFPSRVRAPPLDRFISTDAPVNGMNPGWSTDGSGLSAQPRSRPRPPHPHRGALGRQDRHHPAGR